MLGNLLGGCAARGESKKGKEPLLCVKQEKFIALVKDADRRLDGFA
jgi:hypothetical protein